TRLPRPFSRPTARSSRCESAPRLPAARQRSFAKSRDHSAVVESGEGTRELTRATAHPVGARSDSREEAAGVVIWWGIESLQNWVTAISYAKAIEPCF